MFHETKIAQKLEISLKKLQESSPQLFPKGSRLIRHTILAVKQANAHLNGLLNDNGELTRPLDIDEQRWIRNERAICREDFLYWATHYAYIKDWMGEYILFSPNIAQKIILDVMTNMESRDIAILLLIHKARQLGVTTLAELVMLWRTMFTPGANTLVASSRPDKTPEMVQKMELAYERLPFWMIPKIGTRNDKKIGFDEQESYFHLRHGAMMSDMGRGDTMTSFHLSEVSEYLNPKEAIDAALLRAAHDSPWLLGFLESTGNGRQGWWYDTWQDAVRYYPLGEYRLCPIFLPWYIATDLYPTSAWLRAHPIKPDWKPSEKTLQHAQKATEYVQSGENIIVTNELGKHWKMPKEQMWYWELERRAYESKKELHIFYSEMCATPEEGFQSPNAGVFDADFIHTLRDQTPVPYGVYGIRCSQAEIPLIHQVRDIDIDRSRKPIEIKAHCLQSQPVHNYTLYPLLHRGAAPFSPLGKIIMYEPPIQDKAYGIGVDTGYGLGKDRSVIEVLRKGDAVDLDAQVCEFASPQMNSFVLWPLVLALGTLYSTPGCGTTKQPRMVIEGAANGENVYNELKKRGWRHFHDWVRYNKKRVIEANANMQLWYTNAWSRPLMLDMLFDAVNSGWLDIKSPWFVEELGTLEVLEVKQKVAAAVGWYDDRIMALGIALFSLHALETKHNDHWMARKARQVEDPEQFAKYSGDAQSRVDPQDYDNNTLEVIRPRDFRYADLRRVGTWTPR
jgi:hypothetical protein